MFFSLVFRFGGQGFAGAQEYANFSEEELRDYMLAELDALFNNQASANYIKHISQNWNEALSQKAHIYTTTNAGQT